MESGAKQLDLIPVFTTGGEPCARVTTGQYDIILLQGCARAAYAHAVPTGSPNERYTIAFKFPVIPTARYGENYDCYKLGKIPNIIIRDPPDS